MAKKVTPKSDVSVAAARPLPDAPPAVAKAKSTKPRATPAIPTAEPPIVTDAMIAERAYHKWKNGEPGDHHEHWSSSERELRGNG